MPHTPQKLRQSERFRRLRRKLQSKDEFDRLSGSPANRNLDNILLETQRQHIHESEFLQAFFSFASNIRPALIRNPNLYDAIHLLKEPEQVLEFHIEWINEHGELMVNKGWRVNYCSALGPCRGGVRLHPHVNASVMKFLALEQTLKNSLCNLPMGGGFSGSDFDARNASDHDKKAFAEAFCQGIRRVLSPKDPFDTAADLGCGPKEAALLLEAHRRYVDSMGGSSKLSVAGKQWATGLGAVEFAKRFLKLPSFDKKKVLISGCGDCALNVSRNIIAEGGKVVTLSDTSGYIVVPEGISFVQWQRIADHKRRRMPLKDMIEQDGWLKDIRWQEGRVWNARVNAEYAFPCAIENEIGETEARSLVKQSKIKALIEVANMPCTPEALEVFDESSVRVAPAKAANAGTMAAIGLNLTENTSKHEYEHKLKTFMGYIHDQCKSIYDEFYPDLRFTAAVDINAFLRIAKAIMDK
eukprot:Protomagalhaensia_sp_Gyna_25__1510@NODE_1774_length_1546_cov_11_837425_g1454_i0_p1_GENE_NODE_1774_length_1546_cov_11_837425_g1454_i0NODE_1774_length_1546_cov_11_837425_g1454_i0_p1_ORF_typecomplete_len484_score77_20ELFV_dehydrog/PF00208_21/8e37ELFV_dehydrog_N/PF02812_18/7_7e23NAD_binding_7/PF13241_6/0_17DUF465/PF04325_13/16DUF465/PF04325_13/20_NODE_1774_length_1546_cov_11_837425_g1454_i0931499